MRLKLTLPLLSVMLLLTGCFRQAEDSFDTVGSQNSDEITITQVENGNTEVPTSSVIVIDPNATSVNAQSDDATDASATPRVISPPNDDTADEFIVFASSKEMGFGIVRVLGDKMSPEKMMTLADAMKNSDIDESQLGGIMDFFKK